MAIAANFWFCTYFLSNMAMDCLLKKKPQVKGKKESIMNLLLYKREICRNYSINNR
jgi:hypothetical protein